VTYHFRVHRSGGLWAECLELEGCMTQGRNMAKLRENMTEALNLYLDEPPSSDTLFPPTRSVVRRPDVVAIQVDPGVAFASQLRQARIRNGLTQAEAARRLGMRNIFSYQRLERRSNPSLDTLTRIKRLFPDVSVDAAIGG
jgi:predicted RNase H-like HicB family nuclease/DNA-binding XRE family transcriptional regulator